MLTDSEKCGCARREGMEDEEGEGARTGNCRDARASGLGRGPPFAVVRSLSTERCVDVVFLGYREVVSVCLHRLWGSMQPVVGGLPWGGADTP